MFLFQPARLVNQLEIVLRILQKPLERLGLGLGIHPAALGEKVEIHFVGVEFGAVDAGEAGPAVVSTRQPPHIPVPSTMTEFKLTTVLMPCGRVTSATPCIIRTGPIASTKSIVRPSSIKARS